MNNNHHMDEVAYTQSFIHSFICANYYQSYYEVAYTHSFICPNFHQSHGYTHSFIYLFVLIIISHTMK